MKKVVLITGAASGIGNYIAKTYAADLNYHVICMDITKIETIENSKFISVNLQNANETLTAFKEIDKIDLAINCAGVSGIRKELIKFSQDEIVSSWQDNFVPAFNSMINEIKIMQQQNLGKIVNIASITGHIGMKKILAYGTAKASIINMTKVAAIEHAEDNIRINSISPATIDTPMIRKKHNGNLRDYSSTYYTKNCGSVGDVYQVVKMLEENNFLTGSDIKLDGGLTDLFQI